MKNMKKCIIKGGLSLFVILFQSLAFAGTYIGIGVNLSDDKYSTDTTKSDSPDLSNLSNIINAAAGNIIKYDGSKEDLKKLLSETYGFIGVDLYIEGEAGNSFTLSQCQLNGALSPYECVIGSFTPSETGHAMVVIASVETVQSNVGESYYNFLEKQWAGLVSFNFANEDEKKNFQTLLGKNLLDAMMGTTGYSLTQLAAAFNDGFQNPGIFKPTNVDVGDGSNVGVVNLTAENFTNLYQEAIWQAVLDIYASGENVNPNDGKVTSKKKASKSNTGLFLSVGYAEMNKKWYYGFESVLDLGSNVVGNKNDNEFELKHNYSLNFLAKGGYSLFPNAVNYANLGIALRQYSVSGFGIEKSAFKPFAVVGLGVEFFVNKQLNIFTEYNHLFILSKMKTGVSDLNFNVKSNKISMGVRYYLDSNLFSIGRDRISDSRMEKYNNYNSRKEESVEDYFKPVKNSASNQEAILPKKQINKKPRKPINTTKGEPVFFDEQLANVSKKQAKR